MPRRIGPSPRLRGSPGPLVGDDRNRRSIPASAGLTPGHLFTHRFSPVHPRVCGAHGYVIRHPDPYSGPSPRLRGSPTDGGPQAQPQRSIPASAGLTSPSDQVGTVSPVHPRVCGAHASTRAMASASRGPSPRLRGSRARLRSGGGPLRSIPASAGLTGPWWLEPETATVHPRVCGAHYSFMSMRFFERGPSPRLRGSPQPLPRWLPRPRSIPASAGLTASSAQGRRAASVHPRVCGAHVDADRAKKALAGLSPRLRGSRGRGPREEGAGRSIPASAGLTWLPGLGDGPKSVHPRVCGAHEVYDPGMDIYAGPSPRLRGSQLAGGRQAISCRSIPASAGLTWKRPSRSRARTVHPRVCGAHLGFFARVRTAAGPSPRLRGSRLRGLGPPPGRRSISASAGLTPAGASLSPQSPVHPRVCGAHWSRATSVVSVAGPSPRLRGSPRAASRSAHRTRSIPASAGLTTPRSSRRTPSAVHPRVCGAHTWSTRGNATPPVHPRVCGAHRFVAVRARFFAGPSPRLRGSRRR